MAYDRNDLLFLARANITYHEQRELLFERFISWTAFLSVLLSSAAFGTMGGALPEALLPHAGSWFSIMTLLVTALNAAVLAFGMFNKFVIHADLKKEWMRFLARLERTDDEHLTEMVNALHDLNAREPAATNAAFKKAQDETKAALGWVSH